MTVTVKLFAVLRDRAGVGEVSLELPAGTTAKSAADALGEQFQELRPLLRTVGFAVNRAYVSPATVLGDGDELALIPPVSGG